MHRRRNARPGSNRSSQRSALASWAAAHPLQTTLLLAALLYAANVYSTLRHRGGRDAARVARAQRLEDALTARAKVLRGVALGDEAEGAEEELDAGDEGDAETREQRQGDGGAEAEEAEEEAEQGEGAEGEGVDAAQGVEAAAEDVRVAKAVEPDGTAAEPAIRTKQTKPRGRAAARSLPRVDILQGSNATEELAGEAALDRGRSKRKKSHRIMDAEEYSEKEAAMHKMPIMGSHNRTDKVAFLFLTRGKLPHERIWLKFFRQDELERHAIFVHAPADHQYKESSLWYGRTIPSKSVVDVAWGEPSMVAAERVLLRYALQDPGVAKFALVSESDIPVQSFDCAHKVMTESPHSFIQSYPTPDRMPPKMKQFMPMRHWRKGSQWFVMSREHARMVAEDKEYWQHFKRFCVIYSMQPCIADEHYIPTLLALKKAEQTWKLYRHGLTYTKWLDKRPSPETFGKNMAIKNQMLEARRCHYAGEHHSRKVFYPLGTKESCGERLDDQTFAGLGNPDAVADFSAKPPCYLFARKFSPDVAAKAAATYDSVISTSN
eukprot:jgi/Tetstr1/449960/TSEL_037014.t1